MSNSNHLYDRAREPLAVLRTRYLTVCDGNHYAAMLLDVFYAAVATARQWEWMGSEDANPSVYSTFFRFTQGLYLLEHFIPLAHGGRTIRTDCVPAYQSCNTLKQSWNPLKSWRPDLSHIREVIERIQQYAIQCGEEKKA